MGRGSVVLDQRETPIVFVQARMGSSRLPGKSLMPIGGFPLAILACLRASNQGARVQLLTSINQEDDALASACKRYDVGFQRGSLADVLSRFVKATLGYSRDQIVVRLTGDNVLPDGELIDFIVRRHLKSGQEISGTRDFWGLPYGLSVEALSVGTLRDLASQRPPKSVLEHVTNSLWDSKRQARLSKFPKWALDLSGVRCTVDFLEDYLLIEKVFREANSPTLDSWQSLALRLGVTAPRPGDH